MESTNDIWHYGIMGMKWGIRRYQNSDGTLTAAGKRRKKKEEKLRAKEERKQAKQVDKEIRQERAYASKNRRSLSDEELATRVKRLEQERKLKNLTDEDVATGRTAVKSFLKTTGGRILTTVAVGAAVYAGHYAMTREFDPQQAANYIFPNPNKKK